MGEKPNMAPPSYEMNENVVTRQPAPIGFVTQQSMSPPGGPSYAMTGMWMQVPTSIPGVPPGLEYLHSLDQLICHQLVDIAEIFTSWECSNRYAIRTKQGQQVFFGFEESGMCMRQCFKNIRSFVIHVVNNMNQEVFTIKRPFKYCARGFCCCACLCCCSQEASVFLPDGTPLGYIEQGCACCSHRFKIYDANGRHQLTVSGRAICACCSVEYGITARDGKKIGYIKKKFSGLAEEYYTRADKFGVKFSQDLDVKLKAVLIGATFLIDFMVFESSDD